MKELDPNFVMALFDGSIPIPTAEGFVGGNLDYVSEPYAESVNEFIEGSVSVITCQDSTIKPNANHVCLQTRTEKTVDYFFQQRKADHSGPVSILVRVRVVDSTSFL